MSGRLLIGIAMLAGVAFPAWAAPDDAWTVFVEKSYSQYRDAGDDISWEDRLFDAAKTGRNQSRAVRLFASEIGASESTARAYADAIVGAVLSRNECLPREHCVSWVGARPETIMPIALAEPTGELLAVVGKIMAGAGSDMGPANFIKSIKDHPAQLKVLSSLYDYTEYRPYLVAMVMIAPDSPQVVTAVRNDPGVVDGGPDRWNGWELAALVHAAGILAQGDHPIEDRAAYDQAILHRYLALGLTRQALSFWEALGPEVRALLPLVQVCGSETREDRADCQARSGAEALADELGAALWLNGEQDAARAWLAQADQHLGPQGRWQGRGRHAALLDAMNRTFPPSDLFIPLTEGRAEDQSDDASSLEGSGWAFLHLEPASHALIMQRAREAGYGPIADAMARRASYYRGQSADYEDVLDDMADFLAPIAARRADLSSAIDAAYRPAAGADRTINAAIDVSPPAGWTQVELPTGVSAWSATEQDATSPDPGNSWPGGPPPVDEDAILRREQVGDEQVVLFQSSEFDLPGEIPAYGIWMVRTQGGRWGEPTYLGLQQHFPYVVTGGSSVPLIADGQLRIEVQVRQIDTRSITFPPVGLAMARSEDGLLIERPLAEVERDSDDDGLTDLAEARLGLAPSNPDTDGDSRPDGLDSQPLTPRSDAVSPSRAALAAAILQRLTGYQEGALVQSADTPADVDDILASAGGTPPPASLRTVIMVADPAMFANLDLPFRLMVYTPEQIAHLAEGAAPFYPPEIEVYSSLDDLQHLVVWSAKWVGGRFTVRCGDDGSCVVDDKSQWIT